MCGLWQRSREEPMKPNSEDVNRRMLIEHANAKREKWVSAIDTTFDHIGGCLRTILTDTNKLVVAVGGVTALATGIYTTREGARVVWSYVDRILGQPSVIRESSRGKYSWSGIYSRTMSAISSGGNRSSGSQNGKGFGDVILHHSLQKRIEQLANATANIKTHQAPSRNMLFRKTMAARELARKSGRKIDMQVLQRSGGCTITQSTTILAVPMTTYSASFHSSNVLFEKWKNKFNFDVRGDWRQPKSNIRFTVRQKRADAKKALNGVLFNGGSSARRAKSFTKIEADYTDRVNKKSRLKPAHQSKKIFNKKLKRKHHREKLSEDFDDDPETLYYATFGKQGFRVPRKGFDWTENSSWSSHTYDEHDAKSRRGSHHESFVLGTYADRKVLGLPTAGPLRIEDVKAAFRSSALKWHPDRHQGPSQAAAEEKFKQCVDAYKSLCTTLSSP